MREDAFGDGAHQRHQLGGQGQGCGQGDHAEDGAGDGEGEGAAGRLAAELEEEEEGEGLDHVRQIRPGVAGREGGLRARQGVGEVEPGELFVCVDVGFGGVGFGVVEGGGVEVGLVREGGGAVGHLGAAGGAELAGCGRGGLVGFGGRACPVPVAVCDAEEGGEGGGGGATAAFAMAMGLPEGGRSAAVGGGAAEAAAGEGGYEHGGWWHVRVGGGKGLGGEVVYLLRRLGLVVLAFTHAIRIRSKKDPIQ